MSLFDRGIDLIDNTSFLRNAKVISEAEANAEGIDTSMVAVCAKLRRLGKLNRIRLDESTHRSGLNKHLLGYLSYCGVEPLDFIREYLQNLQPYMLERKKDQEKEDTFICVIDKYYRVSLYIKVDEKQFEEVIISFHEDNTRGVAKANSLLASRTDEVVPVFVDEFTCVNEETGKVGGRVFIQRGLKILPISLYGYYMKIGEKELLIVRKRDIEYQFIDYCNQYIRDLYTSNLEVKELDEIEVFTVLQQISFTSYGKDVFSSVSLLIDSLTVQSSSISKAVADFALITYVSNLKLTENQKKELMDLLWEKFMVTSIFGIDSILYRIGDTLGISNNEG